MVKPAKLSESAIDAIEAARDNGGILVRLPGGWWTYKGCKIVKTMPEWSTTWPTLKSMLRRGLLIPTKTEIGQYGEYISECKLSDSASQALDEIAKSSADEAASGG